MWYKLDCNLLNYIFEGNQFEMKYNPKTARFGQKLKEALDYFRKTGRISEVFKNKKNTKTRLNIVSTNKFRHKKNCEFIEHTIKNDKTYYSYEVGQQIIITQNFKKKKLFNNDTGIIQFVNKKFVRINKEEIPISAIQPINAVTVHK